MNDSAAISALAALSHERRMSVYHLLTKSGGNGMNAGAIASALDVPPSSLSFHLSQLEQSGLVASRRVKRQIIYSVVPDNLVQLVAYLVDQGGKADIGFAKKVAARLSGAA